MLNEESIIMTCVFAPPNIKLVNGFGCTIHVDLPVEVPSGIRTTLAHISLSDCLTLSISSFSGQLCKGDTPKSWLPEPARAEPSIADPEPEVVEKLEVTGASLS